MSFGWCKSSKLGCWLQNRDTDFSLFFAHRIIFYILPRSLWKRLTNKKGVGTVFTLSCSQASRIARSMDKATATHTRFVYCLSSQISIYQMMRVLLLPSSYYFQILREFEKQKIISITPFVTRMSFYRGSTP